MTLYLGLALFVICLISFLCIWLADSKGSWVITPFLLFAAYEMIALWPATIYAYYTGLSMDAYPMLVAGLGFACFLGGFVLFRWLPLGRARPSRAFLDLSIHKPPSKTRYVFGILLTTIVLLGMGLYLYQGIPPFTKFLLGRVPGATTDFVRESRRVFTKSYFWGGEYRGQGFIRSFMRVGWPFLLVISLSVYYESKSRKWLLVTLGFSLFSFVFITGDGTRASLLFAMIYVLTVVSMIKKLKVGYLILVAIGLFVLVTGLSLLSGKIPVDALSIHFLLTHKTAPLQRIFAGASNGMHSVYVIELIESGVCDYRYGQVHWHNALNALPGVGELPFARELAVLLGKQGETTFASMTYLGMLYIDFGPVGVMIGYMVIGCTLGLAQRTLFNSKKTPLQLALIGSIVFYLGMISLNGIIGFISFFIVVLSIYSLFAIGASLTPYTHRRASA